jgi:hypothetical protein
MLRLSAGNNRWLTTFRNNRRLDFQAIGGTSADGVDLRAAIECRVAGG